MFYRHPLDRIILRQKLFTNLFLSAYVCQRTGAAVRAIVGILQRFVKAQSISAGALIDATAIWSLQYCLHNIARFTAPANL
jgi:hypothetical protein